METTRPSLLLRIRDRSDQGAWAQFDVIYRPMLFKFARGRGLDPTAAEDVIQYAMMAIHAHIDGFDYDPQQGRFKSWLKTIVNNRINNLRAKKGEEAAETRDYKRVDERQAAPDELFDRLWMKEHLDHALGRLKAEVELPSFEAFQGYVMNDEPIAEVCNRLGMNANQVYSIKSRLTKKLAELMAELVGEPE